MTAPVLEITGAEPRPEDDSALEGPVTLCVAAGELVLVEAPDADQARALAALCSGLPALRSGSVRLLGQDVAALPRREAEVLRGRIGIAPAADGWLPHLSVEQGMLLARRHHAAGPDPDLRAEAEALSRDFGLDGIPPVTPHELSRLDLARAGCARAFLQRPALLLLESPRDIESAEALAAPLGAKLRQALAAGIAAIWMSRSRRAWDGAALPPARRLHLEATGLVPA
jgi:predicted ABC-type transport system involved in lysophospholipase L1 biosynthesis ATPase subunit